MRPWISFSTILNIRSFILKIGMIMQWFSGILVRIKQLKQGPDLHIWHTGCHRQLFGVGVLADPQLQDLWQQKCLRRSLLLPPSFWIFIMHGLWRESRWWWYQMEGETLRICPEGLWNEPVEPNAWNSQLQGHPGHKEADPTERLLLETGEGAF